MLGYGGHLVLDGQLPLGALVAFNAYVVLLIWPLRMLGMVIAMGQRAAASAQRVHEVLSTEPASSTRPRRGRCRRAGGAIRFDDVTFGYGGGRPVLDGFDLDHRRPDSRSRSSARRRAASRRWRSSCRASTTSTPDG